MTAQHALHVLEIMNAAEKALQTGNSIDLTTTFTLPAA
jgi:hypothetical protein